MQDNNIYFIDICNTITGGKIKMSNRTNYYLPSTIKNKPKQLDTTKSKHLSTKSGPSSGTRDKLKCAYRKYDPQINIYHPYLEFGYLNKRQIRLARKIYFCLYMHNTSYRAKWLIRDINNYIDVGNTIHKRPSKSKGHIKRSGKLIVYDAILDIDFYYHPSGIGGYAIFVVVQHGDKVHRWSDLRLSKSSEEMSLAFAISSFVKYHHDR